MATPNLNLLLSAVLATYDNTLANTPLLNRLDANNPSYGATTQFYDQFFMALTGGSSISVPGSPYYILWVQNRGTGNVNVAVTPTGGSPQVTTLGPGDLYVWFNASKSTGFTALTLTGIGSSQPCMVLAAL